MHHRVQCLRIDPGQRTVTIGDRSLGEGETITIDSNTSRVFAGEAEIVVDRSGQWLAEIKKWLAEG